jgi:glycosyltransferase involved in cell wall biosynthesis
MPKSPILTVITASLNHGSFIGAAVDSVRVRPGITYEHLVIDGDSTDETALVLAERPHLDVRVMPGLDSHEALNFALGIARGEIIGMLNSDDRYAPGALDDVVDFFAANPLVEAVCAGMRFFTAEHDVERETGRFLHLTGEDMRLELTFGNPGFNSWFFRAGLLRRLGGFRVYYRFAADRDLLLRLFAVTTPKALPKIVYNYRIHIGSRTMDPRGTNKYAMIMEHLQLIREQSAQIWASDRGMLALLADWEALERLKLFVRALRYRNLSLWRTFVGTPWRRVPAALALRRRWLRMLFAEQAVSDVAADPAKRLAVSVR